MNAANVSARIAHIRGLMAQLPGVEPGEVTPELCLSLCISGHAPLQRVVLSWPRRNRFWSKDYDMVYTTEIPLSGQAEFQVRYSFSKNRFEAVPEGPFHVPQSLLSVLNDTPLLTQKLSRVDLTRLELTVKDGTGTVTLASLPGSIVSLLIPPVTYEIKPKPGELMIHLELLQLLVSMLSNCAEIK